MALFNFQSGAFDSDEVWFRNQYKKTCEDFIKYYSDNVVIDLTDKIVVALASDGVDCPIDLLGLFIPQVEEYKYKATLIYAGHVAFIKVEFENGRIKYFYKDDECYPMTFDELMDCGDDVLYEAEENGYTKEDILTQIEKCIQGVYNYKFKIDKDKLVILEGL